MQSQYFYFDLLFLDDTDWHGRPLVHHKERLAKLLAGQRGRLRYLDHIEQPGDILYCFACDRDLESIVAKLKSGLYVPQRERSTYGKIKNPE